MHLFTGGFIKQVKKSKHCKTLSIMVFESNIPSHLMFYDFILPSCFKNQPFTVNKKKVSNIIRFQIYVDTIREYLTAQQMMGKLIMTDTSSSDKIGEKQIHFKFVVQNYVGVSEERNS
jgi:hypothetical protein